MKLKYIGTGLISIVLGILALTLFLREDIQLNTTEDTSIVNPSSSSETISLSEALPSVTSIIVTDTELTNSESLAGRDLEEIEENGFPGATIFGLLAYVYLEELIDESTVIAIGEVGETVATDYPIKYQIETPPPFDEEFEVQEEYVRHVYGERIAFHEFLVSETLKGEPVDRFVFSRTDVSFYEKVNVSELLSGSRILLFVKEAKNPELLTNKIEHFWDTRGDNGIFDLDDQDRAFPRAPQMFQELTTDEGYYDAEGLNPYFDLEKLRANIKK